MKTKKIVKIVLISCMITGIFILSFVLLFVSKSINEVKYINVSLNDKEVQYCQIFDNDENEIILTNNQIRKYIKLDDLNQYTIDAFLSIEDKEFYNHNGINYKRIMAAIINNLSTSKYSQGASTISQQLIKNMYLTNEKTLSRKIKEIYLTRKLENNESKEDILESYLNSIYYGNGAYGIANASKIFFNKDPEDLTLSESCIIAGSINSPAKYSPINNLDKSIERRNLVLREMVEDEKINEEEYRKALKEKVILRDDDLSNFKQFDLYTQNVLKEASEILNISEYEIINKNYKIYTYQDKEIQNILDLIVFNDKYYAKNSYGNIADNLSMILDNDTGGVCAVSGRSNYNLVDFKRQPGSLIKPNIIYAPAFEEGLIYPSTKILDEKISINNYSPKNVGDKYYGYTSIRDCVAKSLNIPAVKLCQRLSIDKCKEYGKKCGLNFSNQDNGLAIALGGLYDGLTLQNITESYLPFSNNGNFKKSKYIYKIVSPNDVMLYCENMAESKYCSQESAYLMTESLMYSTKNGTSKRLNKLPFQVAAKTGTVCVKDSNLNTDAYSLAYTTKHTMSVWLGNYSMNKEYNLEGNNNGGTYATEMIKDSFELIYSNNPPPDFAIPTTIKSYPIDKIELNNNHKIFLAENLPKEYQVNEIFSIYQLPQETYNSFDKLSSPNFSVISNSDKIQICIDCKEYILYEIYRIQNDGLTEKIFTIKNHNGSYVYNDNDIEYNKKYKYYIKCFIPNSNLVSFSETKFGCVSKNYSNLINNTNNFSWIFT